MYCTYLFEIMLPKLNRAAFNFRVRFLAQELFDIKSRYLPSDDENCMPKLPGPPIFTTMMTVEPSPWD